MKKCGYCSRLNYDSATECACKSPTAFGPLVAGDFAITQSLSEIVFTPGNDISTWQDSPSIPGEINFPMMALQSYFVFIKHSQGLRTDADSEKNFDNACGWLPRGRYIYLDWSTSLIAQVDYFFSTMKSASDIGELPPVLDYECWTNAPSPSNARQQLKDAILRVEYHLNRLGWYQHQINLRKNIFSRIVGTIELKIRQALNITVPKTLLYTSPGYWATFGSADLWWAEHCDLWEAHYYVTEPRMISPWNGWTFWQWSDKGNGPSHGVESQQIDMDWFDGTVGEFFRYALPMPGGTVPPPPPEPEPIMQKYKVIASDGLNLRTEPSTAGGKATVRAVWPYLGELEGTGKQSSVTGTDTWVEVKHPTLGPLWAALTYSGTRFMKTV